MGIENANALFARANNSSFRHEDTVPIGHKTESVPIPESPTSWLPGTYSNRPVVNKRVSVQEVLTPIEDAETWDQQVESLVGHLKLYTSTGKTAECTECLSSWIDVVLDENSKMYLEVMDTMVNNLTKAEMGTMIGMLLKDYK